MSISSSFSTSSSASNSSAHTNLITIFDSFNGPSSLTRALGDYQRAKQQITDKQSAEYRSVGSEIDSMPPGAALLLLPVAPLVLLTIPVDMAGNAAHKISQALLNHKIDKEGIDALIPEHVKDRLITEATKAQRAERAEKTRELESTGFSERQIHSMLGEEKPMTLDAAERYAQDKRREQASRDWEAQQKPLMLHDLTKLNAPSTPPPSGP